MIVVIPVIFVLVALSAGFLSASLTQSFLKFSPPGAREVLLLRLGIVAFSLLAGLVGALLAHWITKPIRRAIAEAHRIIHYVKPDLPPIQARDEVRALSAVFDQAYISFVELVQAREILDNINDGIVAIDKEGKIAGMNLKARETLEIDLTKARQKDFKSLFEGNPRNAGLLEFISSALQDQQERSANSIYFISQQGREFHLSMKASPVKLKREEGDLVGLIINFRERLEKASGIPEIIGNSSKLTDVLDLVIRIAPSESTVLVLGESGTGKELLAEAIHRLSRRSKQPLVKINCAAIPEGLLESELFGHEKGAFTGATSKKVGKFELADGGTIFLDEIGDMSAPTQAKVLRMLQQKEFTPVGGTQVKKVDVRIITATNKDLMAEVQARNFREDLFYRLNVMTIRMPALRERKSDIPLLAQHFLEKTAERNDIPRRSLSRSALNQLLSYSWPGNIRELQNVMERSALLSDGSFIQADDLFLGSLNDWTPSSSSLQPQPQDSWFEDGAPLNDALNSIEKELIVRALKKAGGIQVEAARLLGLTNKNLWAKIKKHQIDTLNYRIKT
ncbi:MAG: sigma-54 interaction domain-containing protein [Acidobacteriota bacterium]